MMTQVLLDRDPTDRQPRKLPQHAPNAVSLADMHRLASQASCDVNMEKHLPQTFFQR